MSDLEDIAIDQKGRLISVEACTVGARKIVVCAFEGREELSSLSRFRLEVVSKGRPLKASEMLGQKLTVALRINEDVRNFSGVISTFSAMKSALRDQFLHVIELVPPAWLLTLNRRYRIFHGKKASDIVGQVLQEAGLKSQVKSTGAQRDYCVQYGESDFDFVARLLEDEGLFFRFDHADATCPLIVGNGIADYVRLTPDSLDIESDVDRWQPSYRMGPSSFKHAEWDYKAVNVVEFNANSLPKTQPPGLAAREFYDFTSGFPAPTAGQDLARARMEEHEAQYIRIEGGSGVVGLRPGGKFKVSSHFVDLPSRLPGSDQYALIRVEHQARDYSGVSYEGQTGYSNDFVCMPAELGFRPARTTARPRITGPQTALVTDGPDESGRAKVKFPWYAADTSCWTRVAQSWAYNQMGTQFLPRIGSEVVVEFVGGDPDYPLIVGMVYNGKNPLPFGVPDNKTQSGIRGANWNESGIADTSNELRFEDLKGSEEIYLHAQKDFRTVVVNDDTLTVEKGNQTVEIQQGDLSVSVDTGNHATQVKTGDHTTEVTTGDYSTEVKAGNHSTKVMGNHSTKVSTGNHELKLDAGASSSEAMQSITLKVGQNTLTIDQTGISIKGLMVKIEGQVMLDVKAPMTNVNADAMLTLKGGITMVN